MRRVAAVKTKIRGGEPATTAPVEEDPHETSALDLVASNFSLSRFEVDVLALCAGVELDSEVAELCAVANGNPSSGYATFGLALAALDNPHWDALSPAGALRRWKLIELSDNAALTSAALRIDETILHYLAGTRYHDERLAGFVSEVRRGGELPVSHQVLASEICERWSTASDPLFDEVVRLCGTDLRANEVIAATVCETLGGQVEVVYAHDLPTDRDGLRRLARLCERAARLTGTAFIVHVDSSGHDGGPQGAVAARSLCEFVDVVPSVFFVSGIAPPEPTRRPSIRVDVHKPTTSEQRTLWTGSLKQLAPQLNGQLDHVVAQFNLGAGAIQSTSRAILSSTDQLSAAELPADQLSGIVWNACRTEARRSLDELAQPIWSDAGWPDLVLPDAQLHTLRDMAAQVRDRSTVYEEWGFAGQSGRGLGITALFAGASGTGKTLAAEVIANELELDLYRVDLSQVVSKYIGETEKNLRKVFDAAERGGSVLLFDEADGLFGKRSDVKDSHDRYANLEVSYLLQRMETYRGLAILTTNLKSSMDVAFQRRLRFIVQFPFPDADHRKAIWERIFPDSTPIGDLDLEQLSKLNITGGTIRNIALQAAFAAASSTGSSESRVEMEDLLLATHREYAKLEKSLATSELRGWDLTPS